MLIWMVLILQLISVGIAVDSRNDDFNGKWFGVNAAGVKIDVNVSGQENYDSS